MDGLTLSALADTLGRDLQKPEFRVWHCFCFIAKTPFDLCYSGWERYYPGRYLLTSADRVTTAIDAANTVPKELVSVDKQLRELSKQKILGSNSQSSVGNIGISTSSNGIIRRVIIRHADGSTSEADLIRYQAFGEDKDNPTLREGDQVIVESPDLFSATVSIAGAVHNPIVGLRYRAGDNIQLLLNLSAGLREDARPKQAYILRLSGDSEEKISIDLTDSDMFSSFALNPGDQIVVPSDQSMRVGRNGIVTIIGEVVTPQSYPIHNGQTTLSELVERAGGFTPFASLNGAYIRRLAIH